MELSLITYKIYELKKFADILDPYDDTYNKRLRYLNEKLIGLMRDRVDCVKNRGSKCLEHENRLSDQDISSFKEALEFEKKISLLLEEFNQ